MTPRLFIRKLARTDMERAFEWYEERLTGLGREFLQSTRVVLGHIERNPEQFPLAVDDIRKAQLAGSPYLVYFVIHKKGVSVIAVLHGSRDPRRWRARR